MINEVDEAMENGMENGSRDELLRVNAQQEQIIAALRAENARLLAENTELQQLVARLQQQLAELEAKLKSPLGKAVPEFVKPNRKKEKKQGPHKQRAENFARKRD
jgi:predicted nuclease with TOPRIM domain